MSNHLGTFVWYELVTSDLDAAAKFYHAVMGWKIADYGNPSFRYLLGKVGETGVAGLMTMPPDMPAGSKPFWVGYISVDDVDQTAAELEKAGGKVNKAPHDVPTVGRMAMVSDPQGAGFIIMKPSSTENPERPKPGTPGTLGWSELYAENGETIFPFYATLFGWQKRAAMPMGEMGNYQLFGVDGGMDFGGMMTRMEKSMPPCWGYYTNVDAIGAAIARIKDAGGQVIAGPHEVPGPMWTANCLDPQGAMFSIVSSRQ